MEKVNTSTIRTIKYLGIYLTHTATYIHTLVHSSEIRGLCLMKLSSEILQNLPYFWNKKTQIPCFYVLFFIFEQLCICRCPAGQCRHIDHIATVKNPKLLKMKNEKDQVCIRVFIFQKYGKFRSVLLDNFIKHKPLISEGYGNNY